MNSNEPQANQTLENLRQEMRRGSLILAILAALRTEHYGYALRKTLSDLGLEIEENTLYPLLRRLETQQLLESVWREADKRNKRFYKLSKHGEDILAQMLDEWAQLTSALGRIITSEAGARR